MNFRKKTSAGTSDISSERSSFSGKIGFVLAAAGSAVGLGNIWRFPYLAAKYGGGIFLFVYVALALTLGSTLMSAEIALGRKTRKSPVGAFSSLDRRFGFVGALASVVPLLILPYYSVIGGWVMKYAVGSALGNTSEMATNTGEGVTFFESYIGRVGEPLLWFFVFIGITALIVLLGVQKGIEKVSKVMMPLLVALIMFIVVYIFATTDGIGEGIKYYITPDFSKFTYMTVVAAMGQLFYSMSLAMGIMITFGSYMKPEISIRKSVHQIEIFDTGIAFLSGLMIIPACVAYDPDQLAKGPGLMFGVLPKIFDSMPLGGFIGAMFFFMVLLAALTSSISLMETVVSSVQDKWKLGRRISCFIVLGISLLLGACSCFGYSVWDTLRFFGRFAVLDFFDFITNSVMLPIIAMLTSIFLSYVIDPEIILSEVYLKTEKRQRRVFVATLRYVAPVCLFVIFVFAVLEGVGVMSI